MGAVRINRPMVFHHTWNGDMLTVEAVDGRSFNDIAYILGSRDAWQDLIEAQRIARNGALVRLEMTAEEAGVARCVLEQSVFPAPWYRRAEQDVCARVAGNMTAQ